MDLAVLVGLIGILALFLLLTLGVHIAWALGLVGFAGLLILLPPNAALKSVFSAPWAFSSSYLLSVVPLFVLMGHFAMLAGVGVDAYEVGYKWFGRLPGGLAMATVTTAAMYAATTGSSVATVATVGKLALPEMKKYNYDSELATGSLAACGTLGILIPPSIILVMYGVVAEAPIGKLLIAGLIPGVISATVYMAMIWIRATLRPNLAPRVKGVSWKDAVFSLKKIWSVLLLFGIVIGGIFFGIFTPTEAGAFGMAAALALLIAKAQSKLAALREAVLEACFVLGLVFAILIGVSVFARFLTISTLPFWLAKSITGLQLPPLLILVVILAMYIPLGMFLNALAILFITAPVIIPAVSVLGINLIWFGILFTKMMEIGLITPPFGMNVFVTKGIAPEVPVEKIFRGITWFLVMDLVTVGILVAFPQLVLWLPEVMT